MSTQQELAIHLDLSDRRIRDLIKRGILPAGKGAGGLDLDACRVAYIGYLRGLASGKVATARDTLELDQERALLAEQQRRKLTRENDIADGLIAPVHVISDTIIKTGVAIMSQLEALPGMMRRANPELTAHDINTVKKTISQCCQAISEMKLEEIKPQKN